MNALRMVLAGLAVIVLVAIGLRLLPRDRVKGTPPPRQQTIVAEPSKAAPPVSNLSPEAARQAVEADLRGAPVLAQAFDTLRAQFPAVADRALAGAADKLRATGQTLSPDDIFGAAVRDLRQTSGVLAAKASPAALSAIFETQAATLTDLAQADSRVCADYLYGGTSPEFADFAAGHRLLVAQSALATVNAIAEGRKLHVDRDAPTPDDFKLVEDGLKAKGLSAEAIAALLDGKSPDPPLPDADLCNNARTYLQVLQGLPEETRMRIYGLAAELLARS